MRKITLLALAAIASSAAFAAAPVQGKALTKVAKAETMRTIANKSLDVATETTAHAARKAQSRADENTGISGAEAASIIGRNYIPVQAFVLGISPDGYGLIGRHTYGITGASSYVGFYNFTGSETHDWSYTTYTLNETSTGYDKNELSSAEEHLIVNMTPDFFFDGPTLVSSLEPKFEYNDSTRYLAGGNFVDDLHLYDDLPDELPDVIEEGLKWGATPCYMMQDVVRGSGNATTIDRTDPTTFNEEGTATQWLQAFNRGGSESVKKVVIEGFGQFIPDMGAPYQLSSIYIYDPEVQTTEATPITATIYACDENGRITDEVIGKGTAILPEGTFPEGSSLLIYTYGVNALGLPTSAPACINGLAYVEITGFNAETVQVFGISELLTGVPDTTDSDEIWEYVFVQNTAFRLTITDQEDNVTTGRYGNPWISRFSSQKGKAFFPLDFAMFFNVSFPTVFNAMDGTAQFNINFPAEGGEDFVGAYSFYEDLVQLYDDELLTAEATGDWFTYTVSQEQINEDTYVLIVEVAADALPEGETGRSGKIEFTGYACDFTINVVQGEGGNGEGSISEVKTAADGVSEYFDLQGRKLSAAPAQGLYIERNGSAATTKIAR